MRAKSILSAIIAAAVITATSGCDTSAKKAPPSTAIAIAKTDHRTYRVHYQVIDGVPCLLFTHHQLDAQLAVSCGWGLHQ